MEHVEFKLLDYVVRHNQRVCDFVDHVLKNVVSGRNKLKNFLFKCIIEATRMSGEMFTSCFNGFSNYILVKLLFGAHLIDFFLEGDDNVGSTDCFVDVEAEALKLGFKIKIDWIDHPGQSSFCGLVFDEQGVVIRDALLAIAKFGWTDPRYDGAGLKLRKRLIRSKAMSMGYENPQCPILWKFASKMLFETQGAKLGSLDKLTASMDVYSRGRLVEALNAKIEISEPNMETRLFYEETYGICVAQQLLIEKDIDRIVGLGPLTLPNLDVPYSYCEFYDRYVSSVTFPYCSYIATTFASRLCSAEDV